jgi:hypothetical protein
MRRDAMKTAARRHGVIVTVGRRHKTKTIWNRGHRMVTYRRQPLRIRFRSRMVNDRNQHLCGGWHLDGLGDTDTAIERQLVAGRKPLGSMVFWSEDAAEARQCAARLRAAGLVAKVTSLGDRIRVDACHDIRVGDIGDLGDLVSDYVKSGAIPDSAVDDLCREFTVHSPRRLRSFLGGKWDIEDCPPWLTGLILGYPIENTISLYQGAVT